MQRAREGDQHQMTMTGARSVSGRRAVRACVRRGGAQAQCVVCTPRQAYAKEEVQRMRASKEDERYTFHHHNEPYMRAEKITIQMRMMRSNAREMVREEVRRCVRRPADAVRVRG